VVHDGGHAGEQFLMVDLADGETVVPVVDQAQVGPAAADDDTTVSADRLDGPASPPVCFKLRVGRGKSVAFGCSPPRTEQLHFALDAFEMAGTGERTGAV